MARRIKPTYQTHPALDTRWSYGCIAPRLCTSIGGSTPTVSDAYTIEELIEQFPLALSKLTSDAAAPV